MTDLSIAEESCYAYADKLPAFQCVCHHLDCLESALRKRLTRVTAQEMLVVSRSIGMLLLPNIELCTSASRYAMLS